MRYHLYTKLINNAYPVSLLVPTINAGEIEKAYTGTTLKKEDLLVLTLHYAQGTKKTTAEEKRAYLEQELFPVLKDNGVEYIMVTDSEYFKVLTKMTKVEVYLGYVLDCALGPFKVIYVPSYKAIFYDPPKVKSKIQQALNALHDHRNNAYVVPGTGIINYAIYPETVAEIEQALIYLLEMEKPLTIDIETFSLKHPTAGIGTIAFAWDEGNGIAFAVDYEPIEGATQAPYGRQVKNEAVRKLLLHFFLALKQKAIYHNIAFDVYDLIYQLFMDSIIDTEGLLRGIEVMLRNWEDTKLIAYLATNSCSGNKLSLKDQAQSFAGNYALDSITDITAIPLESLLEYNLVDALSTWHVYNKHYATLVADDQLEIYEGLFKKAIVDIVQMQLTGLPISMPRVREVKALLTIDRDIALKSIESYDLVKQYIYHKNEKWVAMKNATLKKKRVTLSDANEEFNPNSSQQLQDFLYDFLQLPVIAYTDSKLPSTDGDTLKALSNHTTIETVKDFLKALAAYKTVEKILSSFIPAMEKAVLGPDGWHYLFGNFNLGGTVSGRLSSSDPNLQNIPANSKYAKLIKSCFVAPLGWIFAGLDFASLEDRISALTTKDPNKLKVYTDGYDGHSLRAVAYFGEFMPDIDAYSVASINTLAEKGHKYAHYRQDSKAPTFALTYQGTYITLMNNCGFSEEKARLVEKKYHDLYAVSDQWVANKLDEASQKGYITAAFGLRVRTPLLKQVIRGNSKTPFEAEAEGRTAGNALGQSWCLLNSRAASEFMSKVRDSKYRLDIRPSAHIHDAQYYLIRDDSDVFAYTNEHLVKAVEWQDHPDIQHPAVKLGGELSIFYPSWEKEITIPNGYNGSQIVDAVTKAVLKQLEEKK